MSKKEEDTTADESNEDISVEVIPQGIDDGLDANARRSKRTRKPL
jgi:hypothetical protein